MSRHAYVLNSFNIFNFWYHLLLTNEKVIMIYINPTLIIDGPIGTSEIFDLIYQISNSTVNSFEASGDISTAQVHSMVPLLFSPPSIYACKHVHIYVQQESMSPYMHVCMHKCSYICILNSRHNKPMNIS